MKLHLGCGKRYIPGFVHVDLDDFPHIDYPHNVRSLPMFEDNTANLIYACHVIEYFDRIEVLDVLREWHRVLKPGGVLRLAVPDFAALVEVYRKYGDLPLIHGPLYGRMMIHTDRGECTIYHRTVYDGMTGGRRSTITMMITRKPISPMDKENGLLISLNVEADK